MFAAIRLYVKLYGWFKDSIGLNLRGLGFALDQIKTERIIFVDGAPLLMVPPLARAYARNVAGDWNEPETHSFLGKLLNEIDVTVTVIDVGASVGEMVIDFARHPKVVSVIAFEPNKVSAGVIEKSCALAKLSNVTVHRCALGSVPEPAPFVQTVGLVTSRIDARASQHENSMVEVKRLDDVVTIKTPACICIIDVEGMELEVMKGARETIRQHQPLVVFEFHQETRKRFGIDEVQSLLGPKYKIFRLRKDASLDLQCDKAWNCVAVPQGGIEARLAETYLAQRDAKTGAAN